jgi:exonuclease III
MGTNGTCAGKRPRLRLAKTNRINKRLANLLAWLRSARPDVVCLQELKAADQDFPQKAR